MRAAIRAEIEAARARSIERKRLHQWRFGRRVPPTGLTAAVEDLEAEQLTALDRATPAAPLPKRTAPEFTHPTIPKLSPIEFCIARSYAQVLATKDRPELVRAIAHHVKRYEARQGG